MTTEIFPPREEEVLKIRAFLDLDGSDGETKDIKDLFKWEQLDEYYKTVKQPVDGHTEEEKALAFYKKDTHKVGGRWIPTWRGMAKMRGLESYRRRLMGRTKGDMNYATKAIVDPSYGPVWVGTIIDKEEQFKSKTDHLSTIQKQDGRRITQLNRIEKLSPVQRHENTLEARVLYGKKKRNKKSKGGGQ